MRCENNRLIQLADSLIKYNFVQKTCVYDEIIEGIHSQASQGLHTLNELHRCLVVVDTPSVQRASHVWRHALGYFKIFSAILQYFTSCCREDPNAADVLIRWHSRVNTRVAQNLSLEVILKCYIFFKKNSAFKSNTFLVLLFKNSAFKSNTFLVLLFKKNVLLTVILKWYYF